MSCPYFSKIAVSPTPLGGIYKINFDGVVFTNKDRAGIGVFIQDSQCMVMASISHNIPLPK